MPQWTPTQPQKPQGTPPCCQLQKGPAQRCRLSLLPCWLGRHTRQILEWRLEGKLLVMPQRPQRQQLSGAQSPPGVALPEQQKPGGVLAKPRACQLQGQQLSGVPF